MSDEQQGSAALGCVSIVLLLAVGSCMFSGGDDETIAPAPAAANVGPAPTVSANAITEFPIDTETRQKREKAASKAKSGPIKLSDLDEDQQAFRLLINVNGYLCAKPVEIVPTASVGVYRVQCITNRSGRGISNYFVNGMTNEVTEI